MIWQDVLIAYIALGLLTAVAGIINKHFAKHGPRISAPFILAAGIFWPLPVFGLLVILWRHLQADKGKEKKFVLKRENLIKLYELDEIESLERVTDPLGAVPDLPFGHLNVAWERFKQNILPGDEIWSFAIPPIEQRELWERNGNYGYVIFRDGQFGPLWVTDTKDFEGGNGAAKASPVGSRQTASSGARDVGKFDIPAFLQKHSN